MTQIYYQEFSGLIGIKLGAVREVHGNVAEAILHIESSTSGPQDLTLLRPRVLYETSTNLREFFDSLNVEQVDSIKVFGEPNRFGEHNSEIRWRIEIWWSDDRIDIIRCKEIHGLPRLEGESKK